MEVLSISILKNKLADFTKNANIEANGIMQEIHDAVSASFPRGTKVLVKIGDKKAEAVVHHNEGEALHCDQNIRAMVGEVLKVLSL